MGFGELVHDSTELRRMLAENPALPIVVLAGEEAVSGEWAWTYCTSVKAEIIRMLDIRTPYDNDERVFDDEDDFEEAITEYWEFAEPDYSGMTLEEKVKSELEKYKPYWRDVIAIYASN